MKSMLMKNNSPTNYVCFHLTLVRHAETNANAHGIIQGSLDTELSSIGYLQSQALARYFQDHYFSHIYSSDLQRAAETTRQIHLFNRVSFTRIQFDRLLRERVYGIAQGQTRQWLQELARKNNIPYNEFTPTGAETVGEVRQRAINFFRKLCHELDLTTKKRKSSFSFDDLSTGNLHSTLTNETRRRMSSIDSTLDLTSLSSDQQSLSSSSILSRNNSFEQQQRNSIISDLDVLVVSHGAIIRELIKYFAIDLQTDLGEYTMSIQELPPNTSITRFQVFYSISQITLKLLDFHKKLHLIDDEYDLNVTNKCSF